MSRRESSPSKPATLRLRLAGLTLVVLGLTGCLEDCGGMQEAIADARALPEERLALLHSQMSALYLSAAASGSGTRFYGIEEGSPVPSEFADLGARSIAVGQSGHARAHLAGCWDNKVMLIVRSLGDPSQARIDLHRGENDPSLELWSAVR